MIEKLENLPEGVIGFKIHSRLSGEDYEQVLSPALASAAEAGPIRCVLVIEEFHGMTADALKDDVKLGLEHLRGWKRIAVVTDIAWIGNLTNLFGWMIPGETKVFPLSSLPSATAWAAAPSAT
ncbi:STAS/SEC14 domain-containing protein [Streptacidiphilus neutrinimicus]|uniref:STAS/SEC14 domain-containing protein n=1 Tax=Streptacidiphilus neutrinimicus TaxID=105420 RepID=UPI0005AAC426|nr:STAS/SEC14 domain-containing protein [Streptacidiphilus neutrinimicus]